MTKKALELIAKIATEVVSLATEILIQRGGKNNDRKRDSEEK